ncbi:MAG: copper chaperone PCu(A)C [Rhodobacteraceae bacterium]|nr:copper chaperone PCu(A)C [Paracoccaceae bacterium]
MSIKTLAFSAALSLVSLPVFAEIVISDAYARSASPNAKSGAAFMQIMNTGDTDDRLIDVRSDAAKRSELHTHIMENGVAHMIHVEEGFAIPAAGMIMLERGGKHVMLMGLNGPFVDGESITVTFVFEQAGEMDVEIVIDLERMPEQAMDHGNMNSSAGN